MAVMTSSAFDRLPLEAKTASLASPDAMALDAEANGAAPKLDVLYAPNTPPDDTPAQPEAAPTMNGNKHADTEDASAIAPITNVSSGIDGIAQFLPDTHADTLYDVPEVSASSLPNAVEAPTSDVREDPGPGEAAPQPGTSTNSSTQQVPETQLQPADDRAAASAPEAMDISEESQPTTGLAASTTIDASAPAPTTQPSTDAPTNSMTELTLHTQTTSAPSTQVPQTQSPSNDHEMVEAPSSGKTRSREEDDDEDVPDAKRTKTEDETSGQADFKVPELPTVPEQPNGNGGVVVPASTDQSHVQSAVGAEDWPSTPITVPQNKFLLERIRNTKKIKVAFAFKDPVDAEALNILNYHQVVTKPMDLSTMETKLKEGQYSVVRDFMADLDQVVDNSVLFNGKDHPVTQAGYNMRAYFLKGMGKMPKPDAEQAPKSARPKKPTVVTKQHSRRESRVVTAPPTAKSPPASAVSAASPQTTFPLNSDGTPLIRRDSSTANDRPKREIHRPPPKDLPYSTVRPKKKKYQHELKFCESVMSEILKPKYEKFTFPFTKPVDPIALNIPNYLKIIKKPMDFGTIDKNLREGQYQNAKEFYNDAQLVFSNCYKFNIEGDQVYQMGRMLNELFDELWNEKQAWLAQHAPGSDPQSPASADSDEEEEEEEVDPEQQQIVAIQKQIAALNETAQALLQKSNKRASPKAPSKKKGAKAQPPKKKQNLTVPPPPKPSKPKARVKAPAPLSFAQKQEISEGISTLGDSDMRKAVQIIRNGVPHLANVDDDEMELDMDEIDDNTLRELLKFIKSVKGPSRSAIQDDDFEPPRASHKATTQKPKKNKPMGKVEQEESIRRIQERLKDFQGGGSGSSQSPPAQDESSEEESSDDESEEE